MNEPSKGVDNGAAAAINGTGSPAPVRASGVDASAVPAPGEGLAGIQPGGMMRLPGSEEESEEMLAQMLGDDPDALEKVGREFAEKLSRRAALIRAGKNGTQHVVEAPGPDSPSAVAQKPAEITASQIAEAEQTSRITNQPGPGIAPTAPVVPVAPKPSATVVGLPTVAAPQPPQTQQPAQQPQGQPVVPSSQPVAQIDPFPPPGHLSVPEGLFTWTPETWGGRLLHCVPAKCIERTGQPTLLIMILVAKAYARNRAGRVVSLPEGARVAVYAGSEWGPVIPLAKGPEGRPVIVARPALDERGRPKCYDLGDGSRAWPVEIAYQPDPKNPNLPLLIDMATISGARPDDAGQS